MLLLIPSGHPGGIVHSCPIERSLFSTAPTVVRSLAPLEAPKKHTWKSQSAAAILFQNT